MAIARALIILVYRVSYCVGGSRIRGGTRAMFVFGPEVDNKELKAPHVPGLLEDLTATSLSLKSKHPIIHARSFSSFMSGLDTPEFSLQESFLLDG